MSSVLKALSPLAMLLGGGKTPKADVRSSVDEVADEQAKAGRARSALFETGGGTGGAVLQPGQVQQRSTLFGN